MYSKIENKKEYQETLLRYLDTYKEELENHNAMSFPKRDIILRAVSSLAEYAGVSENKNMRWIYEELKETWVPAGNSIKDTEHTKHFYAYTACQLIARGASKTQTMEIIRQLYTDGFTTEKSFYKKRCDELNDYLANSDKKKRQYEDYINSISLLIGSVKHHRLKGSEKSFNKAVDVVRHWVLEFRDFYRENCIGIKGNFHPDDKKILDDLMLSEKEDLIDYIYAFDDVDIANHIQSTILTIISQNFHKHPKMLEIRQKVDLEDYKI